MHECKTTKRDPKCKHFHCIDVECKFSKEKYHLGDIQRRLNKITKTRNKIHFGKSRPAKILRNIHGYETQDISCNLSNGWYITIFTTMNKEEVTCKRCIKKLGVELDGTRR